MTKSIPTTIKNTKYTEKLSRNATIISSLFLLPASTQAVIIQNSSSFSISVKDALSTTPTITTEQGLVSSTDYIATVDLDIDGNSVTDFQLRANLGTFKFSLHSTSLYAPAPLHFDHSGSTSNLTFINPKPKVQGIVQRNGALVFGDITFDTLVLDLPIGAKIGPNLNESFTWSNDDRIPSEFIPEYLIGFSFLDDANQILYGWAEVNFDTSM